MSENEEIFQKMEKEITKGKKKNYGTILNQNSKKIIFIHSKIPNKLFYKEDTNIYDGIK